MFWPINNATYFLTSRRGSNLQSDIEDLLSITAMQHSNSIDPVVEPAFISTVRAARRGLRLRHIIRRK